MIWLKGKKKRQGGKGALDMECRIRSPTGEKQDGRTVAENEVSGKGKYK